MTKSALQIRVKPWAERRMPLLLGERDSARVCGSKEVIIKPHPLRRLGGINQTSCQRCQSFGAEHGAVIAPSRMGVEGTLLTRGKE